MFIDQFDTEKEFIDAESIIWELKPIGGNTYQLISSDYWLNNEDFEIHKLSGVLREEEIKHIK